MFELNNKSVLIWVYFICTVFETKITAAPWVVAVRCHKSITLIRYLLAHFCEKKWSHEKALLECACVCLPVQALAPN